MNGKVVMAKKTQTVTMRIRIGDRELEVTGPEAFVQRKIDEFIKTSLGAGAPDRDRSSIEKSRDVKKSKPLSAAQFFRKCARKSDVDAVLIAAYYLEKKKDQQDFTAAEIHDLIKQGKRKAPTNTNDAVNSNIKKGLMMPAGNRENKLAFVLTSDGEDAVEDFLTGV